MWTDISAIEMCIKAKKMGL